MAIADFEACNLPDKQIAEAYYSQTGERVLRAATEMEQEFGTYGVPGVLSPIDLEFGVAGDQLRNAPCLPVSYDAM